MELGLNPALERLKNSRSVLLAGAGGGFDVFCGLPILFWLEKHGVEVTLANLTFTQLDGVDEPWLLPGTKRVDWSSKGTEAYFPERHLSQWFADRGEDRSIYCFSKTGVIPLRAAYEEIIRRNSIEAVLLVDGGTDSMLRGDEERLGTPHEDMLSIAAVRGLEVAERIIVSIGFGIDAYHGVCHAHVLESMAALTASGGYLGSFGLVAEMPEVLAYLDALTFVSDAEGQRPSIVNASIAASIEGKFGRIDPTGRTAGETFWINPLMSQYWFFEIEAVARQSHYLDDLEGTETFGDVKAALLAFRLSTKKKRSRVSIPH
ncbi:MAG: DUF1152 domain-containing protein [Acidobacteriota bacterium]